MFEIEDLKKSIDVREAFFIELYKKAFPAVARFISKRGGTFDDAKDVFQDAVLIYYEKIVTQSISVTSSESGYIMGISKHLWHKTFKSQSRVTAAAPGSFVFEDLTVLEEEQYSESQILKYLEAAGKKCMEMLKAFYYDKMNMQELAGNFGFGSVRSATVQKYKCLEKVRESVKQKCLKCEDFFE